MLPVLDMLSPGYAKHMAMLRMPHEHGAMQWLLRQRKLFMD